ncbi:acyltransferase family protein [Chitinimonas koreensis]|uniref:acyltransferase family protein n=1 Tax=Chitinimonas koreensis TaxID=356302 RepID=UPI00041E00F7|nr:acyltransferase family protein [Chitinimonas koreensis]QNM98952.1 acyltransferase [Chitinimonas koreensis]
MHGSQNKSRDFRTDINGLRAWAVVSVVLYHFGIAPFQGGFVGVDIFFVISGFLMTSIIVTALAADRFSFIRFYMARARRIIPALVFLCATLLILGWFCLTSIDYKLFASHAISSLLFLSNVKFWRESGYFDSSSHEKWLLHTWSLSVEWQFYLILPIGIWIIWKLFPRKKAVAGALAAVLLLSLALSAYVTPDKPSLAFYMLPFRAWEMLLGGLLFLANDRIAAQRRIPPAALEITGFALIVASILLFDHASEWPGWRAALPVAGTALVMAASRSKSYWTGNTLAQWLGTRSYSIYLWHWPVVVALVYLNLKGRYDAALIGIGLSVLLGNLSYLLVEAPARKLLDRVRMPFEIGLISVATAATAVLCAGVYLKQGVQGRMPAAVEIAAREAEDLDPRRPSCFAIDSPTSPACVYGGKKVAAILIGDSHAAATVTALADAVPSRDLGVLDLSYMSCPMLLDGWNAPGRFPGGRACSEFNQWALRKMDDYPADVPVVILNRTSVYAVGHNESWEGTAGKPAFYFTQAYPTATEPYLQEFSEHLISAACTVAKKHKVFIVRPIPEMGVDVPKVVARSLVVGSPIEPSITRTEYEQRHRPVWRAQDAAAERCGVKILDPLPYLCKGDVCRSTLAGRPIYYDDDHLSEFGNKLLVPMFRTVFAQQ